MTIHLSNINFRDSEFNKFLQFISLRSAIACWFISWPWKGLKSFSGLYGLYDIWNAVKLFGYVSGERPLARFLHRMSQTPPFLNVGYYLGIRQKFIDYTIIK